MKSKRTNTIIRKARNDLEAHLKKLKAKRNTLHDEIRDRYPYDYYGIKGDLIYERRSKNLNEEIKQVETTLLALKNLNNDVKEFLGVTDAD